MDPEPTPTRTLPAHECWALLRSAPLGRLAVSTSDRPDIFPINFAVDHGTIVYRTAEGTKSRSAEKSFVAFEADGRYPAESDGVSGDDTDERSTAGMVWSVVVKGRAATIEVTSELIDSVQLPLHPWEHGRKDRFMRLVPESISGRAFPPNLPSAPIDGS